MTFLRLIQFALRRASESGADNALKEVELSEQT